MKDKKKLLIVLAIVIIGIGVFLVFNSKEKYLIEFEGTNIGNIEVLEGNYIKKPQDPVKEGYKFLGWYLNGEEFDFSKPVKGNIKLEAKWEEEIKLTDEIYAITFDSDGGSKVESQNVNGNGKVKKPEDPTKKNYTFVEWQLDGVVYDFETLVTKAITLKAVWKEAGKVSVTFNSDGGSKVNTQTIYENETAKKPANPSKTGYAFVSWQLDGRDYDFKEKVTGDITLKATWKKLESYTVTFNSDGGSKVNTQSVYEGSKASKPTNPTKGGKVFVAWQLNGSNYNFGTSVTKDITLKATWRDYAKPTITFNANGGSVSPTSQQVTEGQTYGPMPTPTKAGSKFEGWYTAKSGGTKITNTTKVTTSSNQTLYAHWKAMTYKITVTNVDSYSPDRILKVYEDGKEINVTAIYKNGALLCNGNNLTVNVNELSGVTKLTVRLTNGMDVTANIK